MLSTITSLWMLAADATTPPAAARPPAGGGLLDMLPLFVLIFVIMYLFIFAPQLKKEKQRRAMLDVLAKGDNIVTIGGIHGTVWQVKDQEIVVAVSDDTKITFSRGAIAHVVKEGESPAEKQ